MKNCLPARETAIQAHGFQPQRESQFTTCLDAAGEYDLDRAQARDIIDRIVATITDHCPEAADHARLSKQGRHHLWHRQFLNPYAFYGYSQR